MGQRSVVGIALTLGGLTSGSALAGPRTALVGLESARGEAALRAGTAGLGGTVRYCFSGARLCAVDFPGAPPLQALQRLPGLRYAVLDEALPAQQAAWPDGAGTADCSDLWELDLMDAEGIWALADGASGLPVAIADSGFLLTHEDLVGTADYTWDYGDGDSGVEVVYGVSVPGHGTFIADLVGGDGDNGVGRAGLAPGGGIAYLKIADHFSALYYSYAIEALADVASGDAGGARILSYSLAGNSSYGPFSDAVVALGDAGVLLVAAAANCTSAHCSDADNDRYPQYPASYEGDFILSVAGTLEDDTLNPYSHYGEESVDLAAPGDDLCSAGIGSSGDYEVASGTSYATPLVAAAASLVWELHPDLEAEEVANLIRWTVEPSADLVGKVATGGRLNPLDALQAPLPGLSVPGEVVTLDPEGALVVEVSNRAAAADATLVLVHDPALRVTHATGWTISRVEPGETLHAGGASTTLGGVAATLITGTLGAHQTQLPELTVEAAETGSSTGTLRLLLEGASGVTLGAPLDGSVDVTGEPALGVVFEASSAVDPGGDSGTDGADGTDGTDGADGSDGADGADGADGSADSGEPTGDGGGDGAGDGAAGAGAGGKGCGCSALAEGATARGGALLVAGVGLLLLRRRPAGLRR